MTKIYDRRGNRGMLRRNAIFQIQSIAAKQTVILLAILLLLVLSACKTDESDETKNDQTDSIQGNPTSVVISEGTLSAGDPIPTPADQPLLTVTGRINNPNKEDTIVMDIAALEAVGEVEYTMWDPFSKKKTTYRGVLLSDLFALWQIDPNATNLYLTAINDYSIEVPMNELTAKPVVLALRQEGEYLPISTYGPAFLVFPYGGVTESYWIWQIKAIEVR